MASDHLDHTDLASHDHWLEMLSEAALSFQEVGAHEGPDRGADHADEASLDERRDRFGERHLVEYGQGGCKAPMRIS